ncbi:hypothetical protein sscle_04g033600 [Sclerotinia sclerotiorum 1980 UF-70]|uniref:Uncharacterized protein n=1 Tax=Sclerotinia sclerotiorum (strain ATCC 18683 / 1980 / Ss-1) TaxID=665079 RepID=A0A1D9Q0V5_SCLS1|nr:hypothetical protein sscle_04g033600 [Sclerotinia sclerotiorum 1980 UF-70]
MTTNIRLFLLSSFSSLPILQNGPIHSPISSSSLKDYSMFGAQTLKSRPSRTIVENIPRPFNHNEKFILEIHEKQGTKTEEFDIFLADFFEKYNGPSNRDTVLIWGFEKELAQKIYNIAERHSSPPTLVYSPTDATIPICNKCVQPFCRHRQYNSEFLSKYRGLLRSVKEKVNDQLEIWDISKWKTQEEKLEKNVGIFGITVKVLGKFVGAAARAVFTFACILIERAGLCVRKVGRNESQ